MIVVTSGSAFLDIDCYAGCIAYAELLNLQGSEAVAASSAKPNKSVTPSLRSLNKKFAPYTPGSSSEFVLVDVSKEEFFDPIVNDGEIVEIIDHHPGYEKYWREKIGDKAQIESIGAACTQICERWLRARFLDKMDPDTAKLLAAGILDNTLGFNADITSQRDHDAYSVLEKAGSLPDNFPAQYFSECQQAIEAELGMAVKNDTKLRVAENLPVAFAQLTVWDAKKILIGGRDVIAETLQKFDKDWALNLISISDSKSFFVATNSVSQRKLDSLLGVKFENGVAVADRLWLRKEILKAALDASN